MRDARSLQLALVPQPPGVQFSRRLCIDALMIDAELANGAISSALNADDLIEVTTLLQGSCAQRFLGKHLQLGRRNHRGLPLDFELDCRAPQK